MDFLKLEMCSNNMKIMTYATIKNLNSTHYLINGNYTSSIPNGSNLKVCAKSSQYMFNSFKINAVAYRSIWMLKCLFEINGFASSKWIIMMVHVQI